MAPGTENVLWAKVRKPLLVPDWETGSPGVGSHIWSFSSLGKGFLKFVAAVPGHLDRYIKNKSFDYFFFFFSLAGCIMLLIDIFVFTRETVSHAQKRDAQIWVTMQTNSRTKLKVICWNFTWILERPEIFLVSFECFHCYILFVKILFFCLTTNFSRSHHSAKSLQFFMLFPLLLHH